VEPPPPLDSACAPEDEQGKRQPASARDVQSSCRRRVRALCHALADSAYGGRRARLRSQMEVDRKCGVSDSSVLHKSRHFCCVAFGKARQPLRLVVWGEWMEHLALAYSDGRSPPA